MGLILFLFLLVVPIAELWVIVQVAQGIGVLETLALLVGISVAGAWLLKQQGMATWRRLQATLQRGQMPADEVTDGALILLGGALLMTPGFLTDLFGLVLLVPPTRAGVKGMARKLLGAWARRRLGTQQRPKVEVVHVERRPTEASGPRAPHPPSPTSSPSGGEDDSRDKA